jgi:predicted ATPase/class 3 adenylate cyclase
LGGSSTGSGSAVVASVGPFLTYLFTDIEGSTRLWEEHAETMSPALAAHDRLLRGVVEAAGGSVVKTTGDGMLATFADPGSGVDASLAGQRALAATAGPGELLRVRMALHAGAAEVRDGDVFGQSINRVARILATGHGGQILLSASAALLVRDRLPAGASLVDLGTHRLRDLDRPEQLFQLAVPDLPHEFPPLRSLNNRRTNLPAQVTSFVGRERELDDVEALLSHHRLVSLIGTGGTGKTRLMLEAAGHLVGRFSDGVWLAELAALGDPFQIAPEIARAVGAPDVPGVPVAAVLTQFLADKDLLLLVDNAEHLVDGVAGLAGPLLAAAPRLRILATSREALAVPGEAVLQLQSLSCPAFDRHASTEDTTQATLDAAAATEAVRLFVERAAAVDPTFVLDAGNLGAVTEICRRLDGIPLAIELAAARISAMSADDIAVRLGDRFRLLAGGRRTAVPRQQTLHALIDWSWDLLTDDDRRLLRRLAIFAGGWTVAAAARIVGDDGLTDEADLADGLARLVDRSLVIVDRGMTTRYRMLETIRQYAREKLIAAGEVATLGDRHFAAYAAMQIDAVPGLRGPLMADWLDRLDADADNLAAALDWGLDSRPWDGVRMTAAALVYWDQRAGTLENDARILAAIRIARARVAATPAPPREDQALAALMLGRAAEYWATLGRAAEGVPWAREALVLARESRDEQAILTAMVGLVISSLGTGGGPEVSRLSQEVIELAERTGTWWLVAVSAGFTGAAIWPFDPAAGEALIAKGEDGARRSGNPFAIASLALAKGRMLGHARRTDAAVAEFTISSDRFGQIGDSRSVLAARSDMAHALRRGGRFDEAEALYHQTLPGWVHFGNRGAVANQLENVAYVAIERGRYERAARLLGAAAAIRAEAAAPMAAEEEPELVAYVERLRQAVDAPSMDIAWAAGRSLPISEAVALAGSR